MSVAWIPCHPLGVKRLAIFVIVAAVTAACGEAGVLDGAGEWTRAYVEGATTTTVALPLVDVGLSGEAAVGAADVVWYNDQKDPQHRGDPAHVIAEVWNTRIGNSRFIQSSRGEIADALPALKFPSLVPEQVRWVTSQLVYDEVTATLDPNTSAAFGLWTTEPYQSDTGRIGVLRVGVAPSDPSGQESAIAPIAVPDGLSLGWTDASMRYELFCRSEISEQLCIEIAESAQPLSELLVR